MDITKIDTEDLITELEKRGYIRVLWHEEDIKDEAERMEVIITDEQIEDVKYYLQYNFDANNGVNWYVIRYAIESVVEK